MEDFKDRLKAVQQQQDGLLKEYQALIVEYESSDLVNENEVLRTENEENRRILRELRTEAAILQENNSELRTALAEQILDEKLGILRVSRKKLHTYFASQNNAYLDRLTSFEQEARQRIEGLYRRGSSELGEDQAQINAMLGAVQNKLRESILLRRQWQREAEQSVKGAVEGRFDAFAAEGVSEETLLRRRKQNVIEMKIGLNWINRLGILLLILAVGAGFRYTYSTWFNDYMKGSAFFLLGALMLGGGEWLFRKGRGTFALGLIGGGVSVLYGSVFYSYFLLHIIGLWAGIGLSVLVTLTAVLLSLRYESRTICSMGLVGGYLPLFSYIGAFGLEGSAVYAAMGYLFVLNLLILLISLRKRWVVVSYISFLFNVPSMLLLISLSESTSVSMLFAVLTFTMYLGITLWYPFKFRMKLAWLDLCLLGCNTVISCATLYIIFLNAGLNEYKGALALVFCLLYLGLGVLLEKLMPQEQESRVLFYVTSLTFAILMVPFQLETVWWSMGWLVEALALTLCGHLYRFKALERAGWGILALCLATFFGIDGMLKISSLNLLVSYSSPFFDLKYTFITAGMIIAAVFYAIRHSRKEVLLRSSLVEVKAAVWFKYAAVLNFYVYVIYEALMLYGRWVPDGGAHDSFYRLLLVAVLTAGVAFGLPKIKALYDPVVGSMVMLMYGITYLLCIGITFGIPSLESGLSDSTAADIAVLGLLILFNLFVWFSGGRLLQTVLLRDYKNIELYPVVMGIYLLALVTAFLGVQLKLGDGGIVFSLIYLLLAVLYIMYGFRKRYVYIRRFGLGLSLLATGKLLLYDLSLLNTGSKIIAYFSFGLCLLGISYLYQRVSARMEETYAAADKD
ncbi:DUF2339 domain-containing protein [Paenibacillus sp. MMS20-IR301]|uniref:DUF2339 domain-containing protein n=1 Tax=Paenibacillus sp. MMS20-IR301 TaxID=2895946 RepID=UPI0028E76F12|nr:DUF2339 domain-containing protein [Paenibacillus sp. MMS20-IR301]WNS42457.1 DUF2339 domain-containing protein [Paenibacillus sp. MMS20-IR301]